jgi:hypothetical protein
MSMSRFGRSAVVFGGLALSAAGLLSGCGDESTATGTVAKEDPAEVKKREEMIQDAYKSNPTAKGPGGQVPGAAKKK